MIAIVDVAEYGDVSPALTVPRGRSMSLAKPASANHRENGTISGSSPIPQLAVDRAENKGRLTPTRRAVTGVPLA
jgi:hypothetical protein